MFFYYYSLILFIKLSYAPNLLDLLVIFIKYLILILIYIIINIK
jgi:hypothetical protein